MNKYFVFSRCEDEPSVEVYSKAELTSLMNDDVHNGDILSEFTFLEGLPDDFECFPAMSAVIIKGEVIVPTPVSTVTKFEIE